MIRYHVKCKMRAFAQNYPKSAIIAKPSSISSLIYDNLSPDISSYLYKIVAQSHLFTACTFLHRTSQPKDPDFQGKKVEAVKR